MKRQLLLCVIACCAFGAAPANVVASDSDWVAESNRNAQLLLDVSARYTPEQAAQIGVEGHDGEVFDIKPRSSERQEADLAEVAKKLEAARAAATDKYVKQDLDILIAAANNQRITSELNRKYMLPFFDVPQAIYLGFQALLDPRVSKQRQQAGVQRLHRYVGAEQGYEPILMLARKRYEDKQQNAALIGPWIVEAQQYLDNQNRYLDGVQQLFEKSGLKGWQSDLATLRKQARDYSAWVKSTVLPRARKTNQLPAELYADNLKNLGVQMDPHEVMDRALSNYEQTRDEMRTVAKTVAAQHQLASADYRDVLRALKKDQIPQDQVLAFYTKRLGEIEDIIRREHLITLPDRKAAIRLASEAESASVPAPHLDVPRLVGNTGEPAQFVLPVSNPNSKNKMDDFNFDAISWALTSHEARPGHELQFAGMIERGVSTARAVYAFNSANVEGWALYAESIIKQYMPPEGQMGALQMRMMREARAFLDPMLNLGLIEPDAAKRFLMEEVVLSEPMAKQEVDRYTFTSPGQATSYFYGFNKLDALRTKVEIALAGHFDQHAYHDFLIAQGLLPFDLLEKAVMEDFVPAQKALH